MHSEITTTNKQTDKGWLCAESLLKLNKASAQKIAIASSDTRYNFDRLSSWSISCIYAHHATGSAGNPIWNRMTSNSTDGEGVQLDVWDYGDSGIYKRFRFLYYTGSSYREYFYDIPVINRLYHIVFTFDVFQKNNASLGYSIYINGVLTSFTTQSGGGTVSDSPNYSSNPPLCFGAGRYSNADRYSNHLIGFASIYNKALSQLEVDQLHNDISIIPKSLHANCVGFWTMQERTGAKAYDVVEQFNYAKGVSPLTPNHADLIGYTDTELGTATNETTQTAKVDFYTKTVTDRTNGSGVDLKSGLPDLTGALQIIGGFNAPTAVFAPNLTDTDNWGIMLGLKTVSGSVPVWHFLCYGRDAGVIRWYIQVQHGSLLIFMADTTQYMTVATPTDRPYKLFIQRVGFKKVQFRVDGMVSQIGTNANLNLPGDTIDYTGIADSRWKDMSGNIINQISWTSSNWHMTNLAYRKGNWTVEEMLKLSNNMNQANPPSLRDYLAYYNPSNLPSYQIVDQTGLNGNIALSTYTVAQMTPGDPSYKVFPYGSIR
jgi:hypothetical protein